MVKSLIKVKQSWLRSLDQPHRILHHSGSSVTTTYSAEYDKTGTLQLKPTGEHDLYAEIQSHKDSTDLALILNRYFNGDPTVLSRVQGAYMDVSEMPTNVHEAMTLMHNAQRDFEKLPVDIKEKFGNDPNRFLATLGTEEWFAAMQIEKSAESEPINDGGNTNGES